MGSETSTLLDTLLNDAIAPDSFSHCDHVETAFEILRRYPYLDASHQYARAIERLAQRAGAPQKFNVTITFAFLSLIARRLHADPAIPDFAHFIAANDDLLSSNVLERWYSETELLSEFARTHFLLPGEVPVGR